MIQPKSTTLGEILTLPKHFAVPKYQRGYAWEANEAGDFFDDLESEAEAGRGLFLGTIIFNVADDAQDKMEIVDGQQRLTTIFLLLIACRQLAKELALNGIAQETQKRITVTDPTTAKSRGPLLLASESIRDVFDQMADADWNGSIPQKIGSRPVKRQGRRIRPIYEYFRRRIKDYDQPQLSRLLEAIYKTRVIRIDILGDEEAFSIFERTNARGTDLEVSDLLKNYLYQQKTPNLDEKWKEIIQNAEGTILKMLKYFYVAKKEYVNKSDLYPKLKKYSQAIGGAEVFVDELKDFSKFYTTVRKEQGAVTIKGYFQEIGFDAIAGDTDKYQSVHLALQALRLFNVSQIYPVISAALSALLASPEEFITRFSEISYEKDSVPLLAYIFDRFSNHGAAPGERVNIFDPQPDVRRSNHNIEHFMPQKPEDGTLFDTSTLQAVDNIGNLLAISFRTNSSLGNLPPAKKIQKLQGELAKKVQNLHYVREFIERYGPSADSWDEAAINARATDMAKEAYNRVWKLN
jgi:uncharacterized protein with ParB-like and HNH nuclease domain